jgi:hypothetical protein
MTWRAFFKPGTLLFLALWLVLLAGGQSRFFHDPGTFWHTIVGRQILYSRGFFDTDQYTFTFAGQTWIPQQWLGECVMALADGIDGLDTLLLGTATILAALFTWLGVRLMRCGLHPSLAMVITALAVAASSGHFHVRPHVATMVGFAITMVFLADFEAKRIGLRRLAWLLPLYLAWSNIHGGAMGGLAIIGIALAGWIVAWRIGWHSPISSIRQAVWIGLLILGCVAMTMVTPYGARLPAAWLQVYTMESLPYLIKEHSRIDFADRNAWMIALFGLVYVALLAATLPTKPRVVWLLPLVLLVQGCLRIRHAPLFAISALVAIAEFFPRTRIAYSLEAKGSDLFETPDAHPEPIPFKQKLAAYVLPVAAVLTSFLLQVAHVRAPVIGHGWAQLDPEIWPVELLDELKKRQFDRPDGTHIFNEYALGGFLIYFTPGFRVFADDRCELFGDAWLSDYVHASTQEPFVHLEEWQARYGPFDYALVDPRSGFAPYFEENPAWELVARTSSNTAALYKRKVETAPAAARNSP